jgi:hypothetical protein
MIPLLGAPFACWALVEGRRVRMLEAGTWNPARVYAVVGTVLAWTGAVLTVAAAGGIALAIASSLLNG